MSSFRARCAHVWGGVGLPWIAPSSLSDRAEPSWPWAPGIHPVSQGPIIDQPQLPENFLGLIKELRPLALKPGLERASHGPPHPWISTLEAAPWLTSLGL